MIPRGISQKSSMELIRMALKEFLRGAGCLNGGNGGY